MIVKSPGFRPSLRFGFLIIASVATLANAADWPQFRGPNGDGSSPETDINKEWKIKPPKELWRIALGDGGYAGPIVVSNKLYIVDRDAKEDVVRAIDVRTGKNIWTHRYPETYESEFEEYGKGRSTPAYSDGKLYTLSASGLLHCLDAESGAVAWSRDCKKDFGGRLSDTNWGYSAAPLVDGDKLVVCPGGPGVAVVALEKNSGKEIWRGGDDKPGYVAPIIATLEGKRQYVVFGATAIAGIDPNNGTKLWSYDWRTSFGINAASPLLLPGDRVFITSGYGRGCALLQIANGKASPVWNPTPNKAMKAHFSAPILIERFIYGNSDPGEWVCLDVKTGKPTWRQPDMGKGAAVYVDGVLIIVNGNNGTISLVKPNPFAFQEVATIQPLNDKGRYWTPPIVADGKLFVRSQYNLVCLDLK